MKLFAIVGFELVFQHTPLADIVPPPSAVIFPPDTAVVEVIKLISVVVKVAREMEPEVNGTSFP